MGSIESQNMPNSHHYVDPSGSGDGFEAPSARSQRERPARGRDGSGKVCPTCGHENPADLPDGVCEICDAFGHRHGYDTGDEYQCGLNRERT
jgi:hypothetical protein